MQMGEETAPGKGRYALSLSSLPGPSCQPTGKADVLSHLTIIPIMGYMWGCFIYRELKLDLEKQVWIHLGVKSLQVAQPELVNGESEDLGKGVTVEVTTSSQGRP